MFVLSHPEDPITGSQEAITRLSDAASGTGLIESKNYRHVAIQSRHLAAQQIAKQAYPFSVRDEVESVEKALRQILRRLGVPTRDEVLAPPSDDEAIV